MADEATPIVSYKVKGIVHPKGAWASIQLLLEPAPAVVNIRENGKPRRSSSDRIHAPILVAVTSEVAKHMAMDLLQSSITAQVTQSVLRAGPEALARHVQGEAPPAPATAEGEE